MGKILIIGAIACLLFYFIAQKISKFKSNTIGSVPNNRPILEITVPTFVLQNLLKKTLTTVGTGFLILIIILVIASKFKLALIALPLSFYLIGQYFVFTNHVKIIKRQVLKYNRTTDVLFITDKNNLTTEINLSLPSLSINEIKSVQKNNNIQIGYYEIIQNNNKYYISSLLAENPQNKAFFDRLKKFNRNLETKLFPII